MYHTFLLQFYKVIFQNSLDGRHGVFRNKSKDIFGLQNSDGAELANGLPFLGKFTFPWTAIMDYIPISSLNLPETGSVGRLL